MQKAAANCYPYTVLSNTPVGDKIFHMKMSISRELASSLEPGMFVNVAVPHNPAHLLRVPLSFSAVDAHEGTLDLVYAVVGDATERMSRMVPDEESTVVGPLGHGWWIPTHVRAGDRCVVVAGGVGAPPIVAAARMLRQEGIQVDAIIGAKSSTCLWHGAKDSLANMGCTVIVTTDDGSEGIPGFTTQALEELLDRNDYAACFTCGPGVMMKGVSKLAEAHGVFCEVSLERMMGCGFGACNTCNVERVGGGYASCCTDGPVFSAEEVVL
ncbi:MAG: dihydroorotate dehydrogenase electron transfer subunit [Atopobiaceae bacterium]|jgi:dihydroorotate dehydrogenase electron transfer subunit